jgi:glyceraldehyde-3-phosphate dehydrogenase (NAD(P))
MRNNAGFVGFDGTESKRAIMAIHSVKEAENISGELNVLLRSPHARAKSMLAKQQRLCGARAFLSDEKDRAKWEKAGVALEGGLQEFFEQSDVVVIGTPAGYETSYVEACIAHDCHAILMGGAHRGKIREELAKKGIEIPDRLADDLEREFFFGLANYEKFLKAGAGLVQCTSCNTTAISRATLALKQLGLQAVVGNLDRRQGDPHDVVKASIGAVQFGQGVGHQGVDASTIFKEVRFSIRASKIPTTMPHVHQLSFVFSGEIKPEQVVDGLSRTNRVVVVPYEDEGRVHDWTSEILEAFVSSFERPISPEIYELLVSNALIPIPLGNYTMMQAVLMVEQMSIPVPNYVEAYLLFCGFPAEKVHKAVDKDLGCVHGVWPDRLSV